MFGALLLAVFGASLPWVWFGLANPALVAVRPVLIAALPLIAYVLWREGLRAAADHQRLFWILALVLAVWLTPAFFHEYPHWRIARVLSVGVYAAVGFFTARAYLLVRDQEGWRRYWPIVSLALLVSCALSFTVAFGSLMPNTDITSSRDFIHNELYAGAFSEEDSGKGLRHSMALVPVLLLALVAHNRACTGNAHGLLVVAGSLYLVLYTFSRSAWLATAMVLLVVLRGLAHKHGGGVGKVLFFVGLAALAIISLLAVGFSEQLSWVASIVGDRLADTKSTGGRLWALGQVIGDTTLEEYLVGSNRPFQQKPHNLILDATMQAGVLGGLGALVIVGYTAGIYLKGLVRGGYVEVAAAALATPALVRMVSAGGGTLHVVELFGLWAAISMSQYASREHRSRSEEQSETGPSGGSRLDGEEGLAIGRWGPGSAIDGDAGSQRGAGFPAAPGPLRPGAHWSWH
jgi:hypothetical protein